MMMTIIGVQIITLTIVAMVKITSNLVKGERKLTKGLSKIIY